MSDTEVTAESWYEATRVASPDRPSLNYELDVDVCVVGAGLAGLTVAREVAKRGWTVAVLEAGRVAWAASGRNTGLVLPGFHEDVDAMIERIGLDHTRQLWALSEEGVGYVRRAIQETGMPGVEPVDGWLHVSQTRSDDAVRGEAERMRWIGADCEAWPAARVREVLANRGYFAAIHYRNAFHIHPLNYALGLAAAAEQAGARIFEDTPALAIDPAGVRKRVHTPNARVRAPHVVLACNVHLGDLMPQLAATLLPITTYVMVTEPLGAALDEVIRFHGGVSDTDRADNHYRVVDRGNPLGPRLLWSGRVRLWEAEPRFIAWGLKRDIKRKFPQLGRVEVAHLWSGTLGRAVHRMPQVGEMERGLWVASGFGGHGLNTTAMAGELIARGIVENDETWRLFAPYELVYAGGRLGRVIAQSLYWGSRPLARIEQEVARYREIFNEQRKARLARRANGKAREEAEKAAEQAAALAALAEVAEHELAMVEQGVATDTPPPEEAIPAADFVPPAAADVMPPPVETLAGEALPVETMPPAPAGEGAEPAGEPAVPPPPVSAGAPMGAQDEAPAQPQAAKPKEFGRRKGKPRKKQDRPPEVE